MYTNVTSFVATFGYCSHNAKDAQTT
jgi:hypothetical protein